MTVWQYRQATKYGKEKHKEEVEIPTPESPKVDFGVPLDEPEPKKPSRKRRAVKEKARTDGTPEELED